MNLELEIHDLIRKSLPTIICEDFATVIDEDSIAERFIDNCVKSNTNMLELRHNLNLGLNYTMKFKTNSFDWALSPEGFDFWDNIYQELHKRNENK